MNVFDFIGPIMIGPSSSHTAGAVRLGHVVHKMMNEEPPAIPTGARLREQVFGK